MTIWRMRNVRWITKARDKPTAYVILIDFSQQQWLRERASMVPHTHIASLVNTRVGTLIVATIYLQLIQNRYIIRSFTVLQYSHQHCVQPVASDVEVVGYL